jgi:type II secretory pathway component GspD/PulD (secretin)
MVISPEISKLSDKQLQISSDFSSPIIIKRSATTTVTVRTGETVVIGGLIKGDFEKTNQKIPFLGDLPLIGGLFRSEVTNSSRTELLIVLTPHVIPSPESPNWKSLTNDMIDALPIPERFREQIRTGELDGSSGVLNDAFEAPKESNQETQEK